MLSCARARKAVRQGCRSFLILVTKADIARASAAADVNAPAAASSSSVAACLSASATAVAPASVPASSPPAASAPAPAPADPEQADLLLSELRKHKILLKSSKCVWAQIELPYLGHVVGRHGIKPDPNKVQSVVNWPTPTCLREVLQFLGLTNFFIKVRDYCRACPQCQLHNASSRNPTGLLQPLDVPPHAWHTVTTDYITGLPRTPKGNNAIAVFVDKLTKYVHAVPCKDTSTAVDWADMYVEHVVQHEGLCTTIISDRGPQFNSAFNKALALRLGITWNLSTARHPQTDGQTERANRIIEDILRHFVSPNMIDWDKHLCMAQFAMNSAWHETTQQTPFFLNHGRAPKTPLDILLPHRPAIDNPASCHFAQRLQQIVAKARKFTLAAQQRHKRYYDAKHVPAVFAVNDQVLLSTSGLNLKIAGTNKLAPRYVGPVKVLERIGEVAYRLDLPETLRIHNVFHVSLLKQYHTDGRVQPPPLADIIDGEPEFEVERILNHRLVKQGRKTKVEYLITFLGYGPEHNLWQDDVDNCQRLVKAYWASKPAAERLVGMLLPRTRAHGLYCALTQRRLYY